MKILPRLTADACLDAKGFVTLRPYDGTPNGDTDAQPIATVYLIEHAQALVNQSIRIAALEGGFA